MRSFPIVVLALATVFAATAHAATDAEKCRDAILKETGKYVAAVTKNLTKCNDAVVDGKDGYNSVLGGGCRSLDGRTQAKLDSARSKLQAAMDNKCGGDDNTCNTQDDLDIDDPVIGWGPFGEFGNGFFGVCPDFEQVGCRNIIRHCGGADSNGEGISDCLLCIQDNVVNQAVDFVYANFEQTFDDADTSVNRCQGGVSKAFGRHLTAKSKTLGKCWKALNKAKPGFSSSDVAGCLDASGKTAAKIDKSESKKIAAICKNCGGDDRACDEEITTLAGTPVNGALPGQGSADDLDPLNDIGFGAKCPDVVLPYAPNTDCGSLDSLPSGAQSDVIETMEEFVRCIDCVLEFKVDCSDRSAVPNHEGLPDECNACVAETDGDPCPSVIEVTADGVDANLDSGWTGLGHDARVPTNGRLTLTVSNCDGTNRPTCGECDIIGPIENSGPPQFDNHRCRNDASIDCSANSDCPGLTGPCVFFFGVPLPLSAGGVATCVTNEVVGPITGTANIEAGTASSSINLLSKVHVGPDSANACPKCVFDPIDNRKECSFGARSGQECTVHSRSVTFGDLSWDCPPTPPGVGDLSIPLTTTTGLQTRTLSADSPACSASGFSTFKCHCDTCDNAAGTACSTHTDCVNIGATTCGGLRCLPPSGNAGSPCILPSDCTGGPCGSLGQPTAPNICQNATCTAKVGDTGTIDEGECATGPFDGKCSTETFRGCTIDNNCKTPEDGGTCTDCLPGQVCLFGPRECFKDNGMIGGQVKVQGTPNTGCGNITEPTFGTMFCIGPVGNTAVNSSAGLPGLGRLNLPVTAVFNP